MVKRVLIIGGYGNFGSYIARTLAKDKNIKLLIAGRSVDKANEFVRRLACENPAEAFGFDIFADPAKALAITKPDIVIHTTGPFQHQGYAVAEACLKQGCHYIDLADGRQFVAGINRYDQEAKAKSLLVVSGGSSVPCLTAALIDYYRPHFTSLENIEYGIGAAQQTNRGLATTSAILSYVGKPFKTLVNGQWQTIYGWQDLHAIKYPELGWRLFGNCDIPDLGLFPERYRDLKTIRFSAGTEINILHLGLWCFSWLIRWGIISSLEAVASQLLQISFLFDRLGSGRSGFHLYLSGTGKDGQPKTGKFYIIARSGDGPNIPCAPSILIAKGLADGTITKTGAQPCVDIIDWPTYRKALEGLDITIHETGF